MTTTPMTTHPIVAVAHAVMDQVASVRDVNPTYMTPEQASDALRTLLAAESVLGELRLRVMASSDQLVAATAHRDIATWTAHATQHDRQAQAADLRLARTLDRRPALATALQTNQINLAQARAIAKAIDHLPADVPAATVDLAEKTLIAYGDEFSPRDLARIGRRILDLVAPEISDALEARRLEDLERDARENAHLSMRCLGDGTTRISAVVPDSVATRFATYLDAYANPRRASLDHSSSAPGDEVDLVPACPLPTDRLPYPRRAAEAFAQLLEAFDPQRLPLHGGDATTIVVTMTLDQLRSELATATLPTTLPGDAHDRITAHEARRLACTAGILPAVLDGASHVLDLGRTQRIATPPQRRALGVRDRTCRATGCDIPATWCEAHHWKPWSQGGATDLNDLVLLCSHHHHVVHDPQWHAERRPDGTVELTR